MSAVCCRRPDRRIDVALVGTHHVDRRHLLALRRGSIRGSASASARYRRRARAGGWHGRSASGRRAPAPCRRPASPASRPSAPCSAKRSRNFTRSGWPQLRLRDSRMTCQLAPLTGRAMPPARQPRGIETDGARGERGRRGLAAEQILRRGLRILRIGERRQRRGIDGAAVLRARRERRTARRIEKRRSLDESCASS